MLYKPKTRRIRQVLTCAALVLATVGGCQKEGADIARKAIVEKDAPRVAQIVRQDLERHERGLRKAAERLAPGFVRVTGEQREKDMRLTLKLLRLPRPRNKVKVDELVISPMSFMAVVDKDGVVIARDGPAHKDRMKGMNLAESFPVVKEARAGTPGRAVGEFANPVKGGKPSVTLIMASPARYRDEVVGCMALGIPLWRIAQRLSRQLQTEYAGTDTVIWTYLFRGDELHHFGTPQSLDLVVPDGKARTEGLGKSPDGFTGEMYQFGSWYGYGVHPLRVVGDDVGTVIFRMEGKNKGK
mgnify:CR=1 FL=1